MQGPALKILWDMIAVKYAYGYGDHQGILLTPPTYYRALNPEP